MLIHLFIIFLLSALSWCPAHQELTVDQILDNIEAVEFGSLSAKITYTRTDPILQRREIRTGRVLLRTTANKKRDAAILFDTLIIGRRREQTQKHYIFSGRWMAEVDHASKQFIKRELLSPDEEDIDPFELGNGPIPLPIGQSKESVMKQFNVTKMDRPTDGPLSKLDEGVVGLHLVPILDNEWEYIDLFYNPQTWLPVGVRTVEDDGTKRVSRLYDMQIDALSDEDIALLNIETPDPTQWSIDIRPWSRD